MSILLVATDRNLEKLKIKMQAELPDTSIEVWPDCRDYSKITFVVLWKQPEGLLAKLPHVKVIASLGAGVDFIIEDNDLPIDVPITRIIDDSLSEQMAQYVLSVILAEQCNIQRHLGFQKQAIWKPIRRKQGNQIAIFGLGTLGRAVGDRLLRNGYDVRGWSRSGVGTDAISCFSGETHKNRLANWADFVISLLPVTNATKETFNADFFEQMKTTATFINVGRGALVDENALVNALETEKIASAWLDVFVQEPLNSEHILWQTKNLQVTPHISAITNTETVVNQLVGNYQAMQMGKALRHLVDRKSGY